MCNGWSSQKYSVFIEKKVAHPWSTNKTSTGARLADAGATGYASTSLHNKNQIPGTLYVEARGNRGKGPGTLVGGHRANRCGLPSCLSLVDMCSLAQYELTSAAGGGVIKSTLGAAFAPSEVVLQSLW